MTTKIVELTIDIPDSIQPFPSDKFLCEWLSRHLTVTMSMNGTKLPPIKAEVVKTMPPFVKLPSPLSEQREENFNVQL